MFVASRLPLRSLMANNEQDSGNRGGIFFSSYTLEVEDRSIVLINLHLDTPRPALQTMVDLRPDLSLTRRNFRRRQNEARRLNEFAEQFDTVILAGDFNLPVESPIYRRYFRRYRNAFSSRGTGWGKTKFTRWHGVRIDHVLATPDLRFHDVRTGPDFGSDHLPLSATIIVAQ